jgi:CRISPR/Cas system-associated protein Cas5 (RAMP superfamily)
MFAGNPINTTHVLRGESVSWIFKTDWIISPKGGKIMNRNYPLIDPKERHHMIAEAAYFRAEKRGFHRGDPTEDWLAAEAEIAKSLKQVDEPELKEQEIAAYERMRLGMKKILANTHDVVSADTIKHAFDKLNRELREVGEFVPKTIDKANKMLKREMAATVERLGPRWETLSGKSAEIFEVWKDRGTHFTNQASRALNDWARRYGAKKRR